MKVYITKYALTGGILEKEGYIVKDNDRMVAIDGYNYYHKPFWHITKEDAIKHAEEMRIKKLQSLDKQIKKISKIKFE